MQMWLQQLKLQSDQEEEGDGPALFTAHLLSQVNELPGIWVQMSGSIRKSNMVVGVWYQLSSQGEGIGDAEKDKHGLEITQAFGWTEAR